MVKLSLCSRLLQTRISTLLLSIFAIIVLVNLFNHGIYNYRALPRDTIFNELYKVTNPDLKLLKSRPECSYDLVLKNNKILTWKDVRDASSLFDVRGIDNGTYAPEHCRPLFSVAILVTYRNRQKQLDLFLPYMHNFLRIQNIHYKIYLIEQQDKKPWNKGLLYNIGAKLAISEKFPCLILHDVDLLPMDLSNLYACLNQPRHMSASIDKFRFMLPYDSLVGGVLAIRSEHYLLTNGLSNKFEGWGGEDDEFFERLTAKNLSIERFPPVMSRYVMLLHPQEPVNSNRFRTMAKNRYESYSDGLNSILYSLVVVKKHRLFTLVGVHL